MIEREIGLTIHGYRGGVESLAAKLGRSASLLYRAGSLNDEASISALLLPPLMEETRDFRILKFMARKFNFALVGLKRTSPPTHRIITQLQRAQLESIQALIGFLDGRTTETECIDRLWVATEAMTEMIKSLETGNSPLAKEA